MRAPRARQAINEEKQRKYDVLMCVEICALLEARICRLSSSASSSTACVSCAASTTASGKVEVSREEAKIVCKILERYAAGPPNVRGIANT